MKTQNDVLSFFDLKSQTFVETTELEESWDIDKMSERFIHTFLEWDLYDDYIYKAGWKISYTACQGDRPPIDTTTRVDTIEEAVLIAIKKVSRLLGKMVHLEAMKMSTVIAHPSPYDGFYKVVDGAGEYCGMVEIETVG